MHSVMYDVVTPIEMIERITDLNKNVEKLKNKCIRSESLHSVVWRRKSERFEVPFQCNTLHKSWISPETTWPVFCKFLSTTCPEPKINKL
jgi:hypothetical protein